MSLHADVEALARALGVWRGGYGDDPLARGQVISLHWVTGAFVLTLEAGAREVDPPTAAIILLGHAHGLRVDVGECPTCRERGSKRGLAKWEWAAGAGMPAGLREIRRTWDVKLLSGNTEHGRAWVAKRPCQECTIDGEPTGRHVLAWERAILDAMPKPESVHAYAEDHGELGYEQREDWSPPEPGDPATRAALTVLAHRLADPVHAAVFGDWCESGHEPAASPDRPRSGLAALLAWWLAGPDVLGQHECELRSIVLAARLTFEMSNFSPDHGALGQAAPGV